MGRSLAGDGVGMGDKMPFVYDDGSPVDHVDLRQVTQKRFQLMRGFVYMQPGTKVSVPVPKHDLAAPPDGANGTDLASVPPVLQGLVASYGLHTRSARTRTGRRKDRAVASRALTRVRRILGPDRPDLPQDRGSPTDRRRPMLP